MTGYTLWDPNLGNVSLATAVAAVIGTGNRWYVDAATGSDGNPGTAAAPFATLDAALAASVANNNDTVSLIGTQHRTSTLLWNKDGVHLIGLSAPSGSPRSRISSTGATAFSPLVNVTATGCIFSSVGAFHGGFTGATGSQVCWAEAGQRNYYSGCAFYGGGDLTTAALLGMRSLTVKGYENVFDGCVIGLDTILRATNANASLEFLAQSGRNTFRDCRFLANCSDVSDVHILAAAGSLDRWNLFNRCSFENAIDSGATSLTAAVSCAAAGGYIHLQDCSSVGSTLMAASGNVYITGNVPVATTSSLAILAT